MYIKKDVNPYKNLNIELKVKKSRTRIINRKIVICCIKFLVREIAFCLY